VATAPPGPAGIVCEPCLANCASATSAHQHRFRVEVHLYEAASGRCTHPSLCRKGRRWRTSSPPAPLRLIALASTGGSRNFRKGRGTARTSRVAAGPPCGAGLLASLPRSLSSTPSRATIRPSASHFLQASKATRGIKFLGHGVLLVFGAAPLAGFIFGRAGARPGSGPLIGHVGLVECVLQAAHGKPRPLMRSHRPPGRHRCRAAARCPRRPLSRSRPPRRLRGSAGRTWCRAGCFSAELSSHSVALSSHFHHSWREIGKSEKSETFPISDFSVFSNWIRCTPPRATGGGGGAGQILRRVPSTALLPRTGTLAVWRCSAQIAALLLWAIQIGCPKNVGSQVGVRRDTVIASLTATNLPWAKGEEDHDAPSTHPNGAS
jgi:hypothetical protein